MKNRVAVLTLLCLTQSIAFAQQSGTASATQNGAAASSRKQAARPSGRAELPDPGSVVGGIYSEKFFNLSCAIPTGWIVKTAAMREGLSGDDNALLLLSAFAKEQPASQEINSSLTITAEAVSDERRTAEEYFEDLSDVVTSKGFTVLNQLAEIEVGGVTFLRGDFQKQDGGSTIYQATMVALRKGYFVSATAIGDREDQLTPLLNRVRILAPPTLKKP